MKISTKSLLRHNQDVAEIRQRLLHWKSNLDANPLPNLRQSKNHVSNMTFNLAYTHWGKALGIDKLDSIITIDKEKMIAVVEPTVSMHQLAVATLQQGVLVPVIPEFKGITVGGAINGAAIESSSHLYGQFNDSCLAYEVLLGNGDLLRVTPNEHPDLFYGLTGSYGSLALIVLVELKLIPAKPWVKLKYHHFEKISEAVTCMHQLHLQSNPPEFIEGIAFSKDKVSIIEGRLTSEEQDEAEKPLTLKSPWSPWFYQYVESKRNHSGEDRISLLEYLFRHDRGAFWMGAYAQHWSLLLRYIAEAHLGLKNFFRLFFGDIQFEKYFKLKEPSRWFRFLLGQWMTSQRLYKMLHAHGENWFADRFVVQDYFISVEKVEHFIELSIKELNIFPLWLCPVKATCEPQIFSPHYLNGNSQIPPLLIDVGIYGMPQQTCSLSAVNQLLDQSALKLRGRKMLYSFCYYSLEDFWTIYPRGAYEHLQRRYHAKEAWVPIDEKISRPHVP